MTKISAIVSSWKYDLALLMPKALLTLASVIVHQYTLLIHNPAWCITTAFGTVMIGITTFLYPAARSIITPTSIIFYSLITLVILRPSVSIKSLSFVYASTLTIKIIGIGSTLSSMTYVIFAYPFFLRYIPRFASIFGVAFITPLLIFAVLWIFDSHISTWCTVRPLRNALRMVLYHVPIILVLFMIKSYVLGGGTNYIITWISRAALFGMIPAWLAESCKFLLYAGLGIALLTVLTPLYLMFLYQESDYYYAKPQ